MSTPRSMILHLAFLPFLALFTLGNMCHEGPDNPSDYTETQPDGCPIFDTDCDGISNATETNDANDYLFLDPNTANANPSIAQGTPCYGSLYDGFNLPDTSYGYYHYLGNDSTDTDDWGVLHTLNMIEGACATWHFGGMEPPWIGVGDLSLRWGGDWSPDHACHENGLEVDIRYLRSDGQEIGLDISTGDSINFDVYRTGLLIEELINNAEIDSIFVDTFYSPFHLMLFGFITHRPDHSDHFHVRICDPDGSNLTTRY